MARPRVLGGKRREFEPEELEDRARLAYRPGSEAIPPGEARPATTTHAVVLEGGPVAEEIVLLLQELLTEVRALTFALSMIVECDLVEIQGPGGP